jgi:antitoxin (DNA-binding transcriptional repressor) of toxin-antitoxin stability system
MVVDMEVSKSRFKAKALEFFREIEAKGEAVIVTDHGRPVVEVRPYRATRRDPLAILGGSVIRYVSPTEPVAGDGWEAIG